MTAPRTFMVSFLTESWVWEDTVEADDLPQAMERAREALETVVREEAPDLACVTLIEGEKKRGVWDWVDGRAVWTALS